MRGHSSVRMSGCQRRRARAVGDDRGRPQPAAQTYGWASVVLALAEREPAQRVAAHPASADRLYSAGNSVSPMSGSRVQRLRLCNNTSRPGVVRGDHGRCYAVKVSRFNVGAGHLEVCANCRSVTGKRLRIEMRQGHKIARVEEVPITRAIRRRASPIPRQAFGQRRVCVIL